MSQLLVAMLAVRPRGGSRAADVRTRARRARAATAAYGRQEWQEAGR